MKSESLIPEREVHLKPRCAADARFAAATVAGDGITNAWMHILYFPRLSTAAAAFNNAWLQRLFVSLVLLSATEGMRSNAIASDPFDDLRDHIEAVERTATDDSDPRPAATSNGIILAAFMAVSYTHLTLPTICSV